MFFNKKREEPPFRMQDLTEEEQNNLIQCIKDEIKDLVQDNGSVEATINRQLCWAELQSGDVVEFKYTVNMNLPVIRLMIRGIRK